MNWQHVKAFLWLRWRLLVNQARRGGAVNAILMMIVTIAALTTAIPFFITSFLLGQHLIPKAEPIHLMYAWDALVVGFLFFWGIGVLIELQRSESLALSKFMHMPVSVNTAFLINYFGSLFRLTLVMFGPVMLGYSLALVYVKGVTLLAVLPLLAAFLLMITAPTYQFQGWLASMMNNPRRRRTVVMGATALFVLLSQVPNLLTTAGLARTHQGPNRRAALKQELAKLDRAYKSQEIDREEHLRRTQEARHNHDLARKQDERETAERWGQRARLANLILPVGWLPLGVLSAAEGRVMGSISGLIGMTLIGTASLWRAYRTTIRQYQGESTNRKGRPAPVAAGKAIVRKPGTLLVERNLPGLSEPVSAIALGGLRSLMRAPEAKMMLLTPLIITPIFGSMLWRERKNLPEPFRPLAAIGGMLFLLMGMIQLMCNQFGFDRDGYRVFVLCAAPRRDILLGKNLAFAPVAMALALPLLVFLQIFCPLRLDHLLSMFPQFISMYLLYCLVTNLLSILAPFPVPAGSLKAASPNLSVVLLQLAMFFILFPLTQLPTLLPWGIEALLRFLGWTSAAPVCLLLTLAECAMVIVLYRLALSWEGRLFQAREQQILETVTGRAA